MIEEGWYIPTPDPEGRTRYARWVLGEIQGKVRYSKGGTQHFMCTSKTFQKWLKRYGAKREDAREQSSQEAQPDARRRDRSRAA